MAEINGSKLHLMVFFGEMLIDFVPHVAGVPLAKPTGFLKAPGGGPANVTVDITKLCHCEMVFMVLTCQALQNIALFEDNPRFHECSRMHLMGEELSNLSVKELKQLENRLERGITRIRSKKHELLFAEIEYMQKREVELQNDNMYLRAKISENEQAQQVTTVSTGTEFDTLPTFDSSNYYQMNMLETAAHYSHHQDQTFRVRTKS